jgi:transcriptional regulator with XRE-family HTH domain
MQTSEIKDRILRILTSENLSSSKFAEIVGVQRSSISHILSGRNKPSLDFLQKILSNFPAISADWLIIGKGEMHKNSKQIEIGFENKQETGTTQTVLPNQKIAEENKADEKVVSQTVVKEVRKRSIHKIVVFYDDNTFEEMLPNKLLTEK